MKTIFILFTCDIWHSHESKEMIAICDSREELESACKHYCKRNGVNFNASAKQFFKENLQTQHNLDDGSNLFEFIANEWPLNTILE